MNKFLRPMPRDKPESQERDRDYNGIRPPGAMAEGQPDLSTRYGDAARRSYRVLQSAESKKVIYG
jgi:hypothetical protein